MPIVLAFHFSLVLFKERRTSLFLTAVAAYFVRAPMSLLSSTLLDGPVNAVRAFEVVSALVESGILLSLPSGGRPFVPDGGLFSVLQSGQFYYGQGYPACQRSVKINWDDEACVGWFLSTH